MFWRRRHKKPVVWKPVPENGVGVGFLLPPRNLHPYDGHWRWIEYEDLELPDNVKWRSEHPEYDEMMNDEIMGDDD
jgi:hypothetical protein